jgi:hypothetical protein
LKGSEAATHKSEPQCLRREEMQGSAWQADASRRLRAAILRVRIDRVLHEFGDRLQRITLRERDNSDRIPIIADAQLAAVCPYS